VRQRLLDAASELFGQRGYAEVGMREIAAAADVTPGMIAYYFGGKTGLYEAIFDRVFGQLLAQIQTLASEPTPAADAIGRLVEIYVRTLARWPWVPRFVMREVLTRDGPLRRRFVQRFGKRLAEIAPLIFARELRAGRLRADLDPPLALISLVALCVFPFAAVPVVGPLLGLQLDSSFPDRLIAHNPALLSRGVSARREPT
jgi:AcrR family transcriptional regulator